jgi:hypothetical protein
VVGDSGLLRYIDDDGEGSVSTAWSGSLKEPLEDRINSAYYLDRSRVSLIDSAGFLGHGDLGFMIDSEDPY